MNESVHNSTNSSGSRSEMVDPAEGQVMSVDGMPTVSMMQSTMLTDLQLIYMLQQQQQQQQGGTGEATMMLSPGSLPLLMSSCQVMALHPSVSQQFVSSSSTGTSPSSLARSPLLAPDGSIVWHPAGTTDDQLSDNFDEDHHHHQGTSFSQQAQGNGGTSQQTASPVVSRNALLGNSHQQLLTVNGGVAAFPGYSVVNAASSVVGHSSGFAPSAPSKIVVATPPKTGLAAPKKPLTPYMKFSKSIWQHVKNANPTMSVCEVGASIGRLWREMVDTDKQKYNDEFQREKAVYEVDLQTYLRATGLQVSDLAKSKKKDTRDRSKASSAHNNAATISSPNYSKAVMSLPLSNSSPVVLASGREGDVEATRLPHIAQMWSGHSVNQQPQAMASHVQNIVKIGGNPFETVRLKTLDANNQSQQEHDAHSSPGGATVASTEPPSSSMSWTWMKAVEPLTIDPTRSTFTLDPSHSAYAPHDQVAMATPAANQQPLVEFYSASDSLEPGEVVVEGFQATSLAKVSSSQQNGGFTSASAHNMYNSYAVNPWNRYRLAAGPKAVEAIFDREQILHTELVHLRGSLSEKTKEVEQLSKELEVAYELIGKLQQQDNPPCHSAPGESGDGGLDGEEPGEERGVLLGGVDRNLERDVEMRSGESEQDVKSEVKPEADVKSGGADLANEFHRNVGNLLSCRMRDSGVDSEPGVSTGAENSSVVDVNVAPMDQATMGTLQEYPMPGDGHQSQSATDNNADISAEQRIVVAQFQNQRNIVLLQLESSMQPEEQRTQELEGEEAVTTNQRDGVTEEMGCVPRSGEKEVGESSGEAVGEEMVIGETIQP